MRKKTQAIHIPCLPSPLTPPPLPPPSSRSSSSSYYEPQCVVRSGRGKNRYSPMEVKAPSRKGRSVTKRVSCGSDDEGPKKPRKRREAVSLACYFCRKRKIACRQPPPGSPDRTCKSVFFPFYLLFFSYLTRSLPFLVSASPVECAVSTLPSPVVGRAVGRLAPTTNTRIERSWGFHTTKHIRSSLYHPSLLNLPAARLSFA